MMQIVPSNVLQRYKAVSGCIIANYQHQVEVFRNFSENNSLKRRLRKEAVRSTLNYLSEDLMDIRENIKKMNWSLRFDEEDLIILGNYLRDLYDMATLLGDSAQLDVNSMIDNVSTAEYVTSQSIIALLEKISSVPKDIFDIDNKILDIVHETGYAFQKFMIFTVTHLHVEDSFITFKQLSEKVLLQLSTTFLEFKDKICVVEFIYYTKRSLQLLYKYFVRIVKFMENVKFSEPIGELLFIISNYTKFHISTISKALNSGNPINNLLYALEELELQHSTILEEIRRILKSNPTDNEPNGLTYHVVLFFTETIQNMISIEEFGRGFTISST